MRNKPTYSSDLICSTCGSIMTISRCTSRSREKYHIKDMYCINCKKTTKFIELGNADIIKKELEFKDNLNKIEELVYELTHNDCLCKQKSI